MARRLILAWILVCAVVNPSLGWRAYILQAAGIVKSNIRHVLLKTLMDRVPHVPVPRLNSPGFDRHRDIKGSEYPSGVNKFAHHLINLHPHRII